MVTNAAVSASRTNTQQHPRRLVISTIAAGRSLGARPLAEHADTASQRRRRQNGRSCEQKTALTITNPVLTLP